MLDILDFPSIAKSNTDFYRQDYPQYIKYMGSKTKLMDFVLEGINHVHREGAICDLFSGSASLSGAIGRQNSIVSNDIQTYSSIVSKVYLTDYLNGDAPTSKELVSKARRIVQKNKANIGLDIDYENVGDILEFHQLEKQQRELLNRSFSWRWHLFVKNYSGTWWSLEQCLWIDGFRQVIERYRGSPFYNSLLASLMYAMAYTSQGTGHYAQYRDAKDDSSMKDISIYRRRSIVDYFARKVDETYRYLPKSPSSHRHIVMADDYRVCLNQIKGGTVYADPPYCFVHYSRFYHAIETLVLYDYPQIQIKNGHVVKGRYRENRHQSPFCIKTQVRNAFDEMFCLINQNKQNLVLSYSDTGMITIDDLAKLASDRLKSYELEYMTKDYQHMTLGRSKDRHRDVKECLILGRQK